MRVIGFLVRDGKPSLSLELHPTGSATEGPQAVRTYVVVRGVRGSSRAALTDGGLAQLGERLAGSQKVRGSSPLSSTLT